MVIEFFKGGADRQLERIESVIVEMLVDCHREFDLAAAALIGGADPSIIGPEIRTIDRRVNKAERAVRKDLVVHLSVRRGQADLPLVLATMSIVKDAERIGDYAKNVWDLADAGLDWSQAADLPDLITHRDRVSELLREAAAVFGARDAAAAHRLLATGDDLQDDEDRMVAAQFASALPTGEAVGRALFHRHLKRIIAHTMNVLTSLVMPIHRLDYYDEDKADRDGHPEA